MVVKWANKALTIKTKVKQSIQHYNKRILTGRAMCLSACKGKEIEYEAGDS